MKTLENLQKDKSVLEWPVYMRRAIDLAGIVLSATPNPRVGCVIINGAEIVSEGWHAAAGLAHAEVMAKIGGHGSNDLGEFVNIFADMEEKVVTLEQEKFEANKRPFSTPAVQNGLTPHVF